MKAAVRRGQQLCKSEGKEKITYTIAKAER